MAIEDRLYKGLKFYQRAPAFISKSLGYLYSFVPLSIRYGNYYSDYKELIHLSERWNQEQIDVFTLEKLKMTFVNAYENTKFYNHLFSSIQFNPCNFSELNDLLKVPYTDKSVLRENKLQILNSKIPSDKLIYVTTGGTSGIPVEVFYIKGRERTREFVFMTDQWKRVGYKYGDRIARIRGTVVDYNGNKTFFRYEPVKNRLYLSTYDLYEENIPIYIEKLKKFKPHFLHTYPSAIILLAKYIITHNIKIDGLKAVLCSSEQFYPGQRELIEKAFNCRVYSWYGHTEYSTLAGECECSTNYHIYFQYGYTELIDENGHPIIKSGIRGEIVGTSYEMQAFPIIRYRTGDYAEWVDGKCSCGRNYKLMKNVMGRWYQERIITKKDSEISLTALNMHSDIFDNVVQYQFYQKVKGKVILRVIKSERYKEKDENKIVKCFNEKFKDLVDFDIQYVNAIPRTERGKHKFLISELTAS
jgi:phenylacetate-CoA ligase